MNKDIIDSVTKIFDTPPRLVLQRDLVFKAVTMAESLSDDELKQAVEALSQVHTMFLENRQRRLKDDLANAKAKLESAQAKLSGQLRVQQRSAEELNEQSSGILGRRS